MQSAFAVAQPMDVKHCSKLYYASGAEMAAAAAPPPTKQEPHHPFSPFAAQPGTPGAAFVSPFQHAWQATQPAASADGYTESDGSAEAPAQRVTEGSTQKKAKTAKRGSKYSRDLDKLSKQEQRMMKNRESAARSRQRRQQHTTELEETNAQLLAEVASLRVQLADSRAHAQNLQWQLQLAHMASTNNTNAPGSQLPASNQMGGVDQPNAIAGPASMPSLSLSLPPLSTLMGPPPQPAGGAQHSQLQLTRPVQPQDQGQEQEQDEDQEEQQRQQQHDIPFSAFVQQPQQQPQQQPSLYQQQQYNPSAAAAATAATTTAPALFLNEGLQHRMPSYGLVSAGGMQLDSMALEGCTDFPGSRRGSTTA